jgi:hypothetical protein
MFFSSQNIDFPFLFAETLGASLFLPLFFNTLFARVSFIGSIKSNYWKQSILAIKTTAVVQPTRQVTR